MNGTQSQDIFFSETCRSSTHSISQQLHVKFSIKKNQIYILKVMLNT